MISQLGGCSCQSGEGLFRDPTLLPPKARQLLSEVGDEKITSIQLVRTPLKNRTLINILSGGKLDQEINNLNIDKVFHLAMVINNKYLLDKQAVIHFERDANVVEPNSETLMVPVSRDITISELIENTKKQMGNNFGPYNAENNNCSVFISNVLSSNGLSNGNTDTFVNQKAKEIISKFPEFAKYLVNAVTDVAAIADKAIQGEGYGATLKALEKQKKDILRDIARSGKDPTEYQKELLMRIQKEIDTYIGREYDDKFDPVFPIGYKFQKGSGMYELYNFGLPTCVINF